MTRTRLTSTAVVVGIAGALTVGAALLPVRGQAPGVRPLTANVSDISYLHSDDLEGQIAALGSRADAQPADSRTTGALALLLIEQARQAADPTYYAQASDAIARSFDAQPRGNDVALAAKAALLSSQHRFAAALATADAALRLDPYSTAAFGVRVDALTELGRLPEALRAAREFDARQPGLAATTRLAYQAELRGDDTVAQRYFSVARRDASDPTTGAFVEYHLGELARRAGRLEVANAHYRAALALVPDDVAATAGRVRVLALRGKTAQAIAGLSELVARVPMPEHVIALGELHLLVGDEAAASAQFDVVRASAELARASGVRPDLELAWFEADHGNPRRALQLARAEWGKRQPPMVADALAWALHVNGRDAAALRYTRLATAFGGDARSWHHRGVVEASLGMEAKAVAHLRRALTVDAGYNPWQAEQVRAALARLGVRP